MTSKIVGAVFILLGCGTIGMLAAVYKVREEHSLRELTSVLDYMICDLQYRMTPLPDLCRCTAMQTKGRIQDFFMALNQELENQIAPDVNCCVHAALEQTSDIPYSTRDALSQMGQTLGRFDIEGQIRSLEGIKAYGLKKLEVLESNRDVRLRSYKTLGLCAGAALAILFL